MKRRIRISLSASMLDAPTAHSVLAQVSLGVSRRAEIGVRVCAIFCDPARAWAQA